ncbi:hypothetical protein EAO76_28235 [Streptomyces sp. sk2.1]|nr:hypothetical protein EAO76_28235 [Streptomyces sp. sk2.1]
MLGRRASATTVGDAMMHPGAPAADGGARCRVATARPRARSGRDPAGPDILPYLPGVRCGRAPDAPVPRRRLGRAPTAPRRRLADRRARDEGRLQGPFPPFLPHRTPQCRAAVLPAAPCAFCDDAERRGVRP